MSARATTYDDWGPAFKLGPTVNGPSSDLVTCVSADALAFFFFEELGGHLRDGGFGGVDLWMTMRPDRSSPWGTPINLGPVVNTPFDDGSASLSPDESALYSYSNRPCASGGHDLWQAPIVPVVDFDHDGSVGMEDLLMMIESWGTDESLCDIGPMPWGDGVVEAADLEVLMKYWGQDVRDLVGGPEKPELVAHWKLDETEGTIAHDSAGTSDANLMGDPVWRPAGGQIDGALQFDGADDYVEAGFVLDPVKEPFGAFAWIKGSIPGQVIISQANAGDWLQTDPVRGNLMTGLCRLPNFIDPVLSQTPVADDQWHRVGLVWDGVATRILHVDGMEVARHILSVCTSEETVGQWLPHDGSLHIGAPNRLNSPGYWTGLIDDVQIYRGVVKP